MEIFDTIANKSKDVAEKAKNIAEITSLNAKISLKESEMKNVYREIGLAIYTNKEAWKEVDLSELFGKLEAMESEVTQMKEKILSLKEIQICPQCNAEIDKTAAFCPKCGAQMPVAEEPVEEVVVDTVAEEVAAEPVVEESVEEATSSENTAE